MAGFATVQARPLFPRQLLFFAVSVGVTFPAAVDAAQVTPAPRWRVFALAPAFPVALPAAFAASSFASFEGATRTDKGQ